MATAADKASADRDRILKDFGASVRRFRTQRGLSQEDLAGLCSLDRTYMGGVERGERNLSLINIVRIAAALEVDPSKLVAGLGR